MRVAFLNLCHCDPVLTARTANKLTEHSQFDMYIHVDKKSDIQPFYELLKENRQVFFIRNRQSVYWGGYHAVLATLEMLRVAEASERQYDRYVILQNLDYPLKSNDEIFEFFQKNAKVEFIRACRIARTKDWHFAEKYKIRHKFDDEFYLSKPGKLQRIIHNLGKWIKSIPNLGFNGIIQETDGEYPIYYGAAQWSITGECAEHILSFAETHEKFNRCMQSVKFPDEEYFHTIVHNSKFKYRCVKYDEPEKRWLVNWRNLHYFEYPKEIVTFTEKDFDKLMHQDALFCRKVRSGISDTLLDKIDQATSEKNY